MLTEAHRACSGWDLALAALQMLVHEHGAEVTEVDVVDHRRVTFLLRIPVPQEEDS